MHRRAPIRFALMRSLVAGLAACFAASGALGHIALPPVENITLTSPLRAALGRAACKKPESVSGSLWQAFRYLDEPRSAAHAKVRCVLANRISGYEAERIEACELNRSQWRCEDLAIFIKALLHGRSVYVQTHGVPEGFPRQRLAEPSISIEVLTFLGGVTAFKGEPVAEHVSDYCSVWVVSDDSTGSEAYSVLCAGGPFMRVARSCLTKPCQWRILSIGDR